VAFLVLFGCASGADGQTPPSSAVAPVQRAQPPRARHRTSDDRWQRDGGDKRQRKHCGRGGREQRRCGAGGGGGAAIAGAAALPAARRAEAAPAARPQAASPRQRAVRRFESGQIDPQKWKLTKPTGSASITVDSEHVHSGQHAVHIKLVAGQQARRCSPKVSPSQPRRTHFTRARSCISRRAAGLRRAATFTWASSSPGQKRRRRRASRHRHDRRRQAVPRLLHLLRSAQYEFGPWSKATVEPTSGNASSCSKTARAPPKRSAKSGSTAPSSPISVAPRTARARPRTTSRPPSTPLRSVFGNTTRARSSRIFGSTIFASAQLPSAAIK